MKKKFWPKVDCSTEKFFHMFDISSIFLLIIYIFKISKQFSLGKKFKNDLVASNFVSQGRNQKTFFKLRSIKYNNTTI